MAPEVKPTYVVETFTIDDGRKLKAVVPDKDGYFCGMPLAVLGVVTRNMTEYDIKSMIDNITGQDSSMRLRLEEGNLFGEHGHPFTDFSTPQGLQRVLHLEPKDESHHFRKIWIQHVPDLKMDIVFADVKPSGPYGKYFEEKMIDPTRNCSFSLRSLTNDRVDPQSGVTKRVIVKLVTFDASMASGGYKQASKRYTASTEDFRVSSQELIKQTVNYRDIMAVQSVGLEVFSQTELNDILKSNRVTISRDRIEYVNKAEHTLVDAATRRESGIFHSMIGITK